MPASSSDARHLRRRDGRGQDRGPDRFFSFSVRDVFVAGYGTDYAEKYRHLPYIGAVE